MACLVLWGVLGLVPQAKAADAVARGAPASWVDELPLPAPRAGRLRQVEDGIYYLLLDSQVKPQGAIDTFYTRNAYKVTDRRGLEEAARLEIDYDPSQERIVLHHIRVVRHGVAGDRLADADIEVLRREQGLDKGVFDGRMTIHIEIKDVQVGDIVDYAYSWESRASFWPGQFFGHVTTNWAVPLELMRYRLFWPADRPLTIRNRNTDLKPSKTRAGDDTLYEWRIADAQPTHSEDGTPEWYPTWGTIALSSMKTWSQVVQWALPLYSGHDALPPELVARTDAIMRKYAKPEDRITQAMRLVEDDLRYVSLSIGAGSYTPRSPAEVFRSGFGDCKDKSQLLVALLRKMGVEAYVALTDMDAGHGLSDVAPAANVFDHAIVQVRFHGRSYWLDPTGSNEGGRFPFLAAVNYGWALPVAPGQAKLERIARPQNIRPTYRTVERYELIGGERASLTLNVVTTYLAAEADAMRSSIASQSQAQLETNYQKFYAGLYPGLVRAQPIRIQDDRDANRIVVTEAYRLSPDDLRRHKLIEKFIVKASSLDAYDKVPSGKRATPFSLAWPVNKQHTIVLVTPGRRPPAPQDVSIAGAGFTYSLGVARDGDTLTLDYKLSGVSDVLDARDVPDAAADSDAVSDDNYWYLDLTSTAGGHIGDSASPLGVTWRDVVLYLLAAVGAAAILGALGFALHRGLHADDKYAAHGFYYPVAASKFLLLSVVTVGLYPLFWGWKCWRWIVRQDGRRLISPFWRGVLAIFWLYPLFADAARREVLPLWLRGAGFAAAGLYPLWLLAGVVAGILGLPPLLAVLFGVSACVCFLPVLIAVNRLNATHGEVLTENSKMTGMTSVAVGLGLVYWVALLFLLVPLGTV